MRVTEIGPGSRVVILDKDKDNNIKKIMVIDSRYNNGSSYYGNWVYGKVDTKDSDCFWLKKDSDGSYIKVYYGSINSSYVYTDRSYWFEIKDGKLQSVPTTTDPSRQTGRYDLSGTIYQVSKYNTTEMDIYLTSNTRVRYTIDSTRTKIEGRYQRFSDLYNARYSDLEGLTVEFKLRSNSGNDNYIDYIYIR